METQELLRLIATGEDSQHQFKADIKNAAALGAEIVAFSNTNGGLLFIGVSDDGAISGLTTADVARLNQTISNAASHNVRPPIAPVTQNIQLPAGMVIVLTIEPGYSKPYMDTQGYIWVKKGADKRRVTAREEMQRMFQSAGLVHADAIPVQHTSIVDVDTAYFDAFFERVLGEPVVAQDMSRGQLLENMNLMQQGQLNISGALLFASHPQRRLPIFMVKAVAFPGYEIADEHYHDSQDMSGKLADVFQKTLSFVLSNIHHRQQAKNVNSTGEPEIPRIVFEEIIANALIHRDYFISAPVKLLVFIDRVEIISPGHLPNNLTVENIKLGNSNVRNPILASFAPKVLPYRGIGSGIRRAIKAYPAIEFIDDRIGNSFQVIIRRDISMGSD